MPNPFACKHPMSRRQTVSHPGGGRTVHSKCFHCGHEWEEHTPPLAAVLDVSDQQLMADAARAILDNAEVSELEAVPSATETSSKRRQSKQRPETAEIAF